MKKTKIFIILFSILIIFLFVIRNSAKAEAAQDLAAETLSVSPASPEANKTAAITVRVKNIGSEFVLNFPLKYSLAFNNFVADGPAAISPARDTLVKTNDYITFNLYGHFTKLGSTALSFTVDPAGYLVESDTGNNSAAATIDVQGNDLAVESLTILPANPMVGQICYARVKVKNAGTYKLYSDSGLNITRSFQDFSIDKASSTLPSLANVINPGDYFYYEYEGKFSSAGAKKFNFNIDPDDVLHESDLSNNIYNLNISAFNAAETDLAVDSVSLGAEKIVMGVPFDLTLGVKNNGKTSLTDAVGLIKSALGFNLGNFEYGLNDFTADDYPVLTSPLNPASIFHYKFRGAFSQPGNLNISFSVNKNHELPESTYANNATTTAITVYKSLAEADSFSLLAKSVSLISSTTAIIAWTTDQKTTADFYYNLSHNNISDNKIAVTDSALEHKITLNNLTPGANYIFSITIKNNTAEKLDMINNFSMPESDFLKITSGPSVSSSGQKAVISWGTNLTASSRVYYKKQGASSLTAAGSDTLVANHQVELIGLADGVYDYFLSSTSTPKTNFKTGWLSFEIKAAAISNSSAPAAGQPNTGPAAGSALSVNSLDLYNRLKGKIILRVQDKGQAYYISPKDKKIYSLGKPEDAFPVIRSQGEGITNANLAKISVGLSGLSGADADSDGLPDAAEVALGTNTSLADTDGDGYKDKDELAAGYSPLVKNLKMSLDHNFAAGQKGKIFLQVEGRGEAWYINPVDNKRYFLSRPADAFNLMRQLGAGVSNNDFIALSK